ncbi:hypothetical protein HBI56_192520 [Parastagonospora nodorum]|nr:hypothetical protein HBI10_162190 [Parastagonospora nodorum]KAH4019573.1 hypothetical protein HBI13_126550 [Parastagonospora nodorum]KAH4019667.1 hypothetical protein HBI09_184150 [Parastagonospora nodorum]KAH4061419.1 hypothetical protein HBH50_220630 [Parastagonospora nodorum]KAH4079864.1 hypothetical protein HBH48_214120 [Parastagonospora nodorum]
MAKADPEHGPGTPLQNYRAHILSKLLLSAAQLAQLKFRLTNPGWPMLWRGLQTIRDGTNRRTWDWEDDDNELLQVFRIEFGLSWDAIAEFLVIGMRPSQCEQLFERNKAIHLYGAWVLTDDQWKKFNTPGAMVFY